MKTEIIAILDRSGSMGGLESDTIGGFNSFIDSQKKVEGECNVTTVLFDNEIETLYEAVPVKEVKPLTNNEYYVRGMTALLDAIGSSANKSGARYAAMPNPPDKVIVLIITDGHENSSREFSNDQVKSMIKHQEDNYGWEFVYLGANQNAFDVAVQGFGMKMSNVATYTSSAVGTKQAYAAFGTKAASLRAGQDAVSVNMSSLVENETN